MTALLVTVSGYVSCLMLAIAGAGHVRHIRAFEQTLRRQDVFPMSVLRVLARGLVAVELGLAAAALLAFSVLSSPVGARVVLAAMALLYGLYAAYAWLLVARGSDVPCGCSGGDHPVDRTVVMRAAALSLAALGAAIGADSILAVSADAEFIIAVAASVALTAILWALPAAVHDPGAARTRTDAPTVLRVLQGGH